MKVHEIIPIVKIIYKQRTICSNYGESIKIYRRARARFPLNLRELNNTNFSYYESYV
jgi:hypothetical protein